MNEPNNLEHYLSTWNLVEPQLLTRTFTSSIYTVRQGGETVILKLLSANETTEQVGGLALRYFDGHGAVRLLRYDAGAHLLEYAAGDELITLVERGRDEEATRIIADVIGQLHSVPQEGGQDGLFVLARWFGDLFSQAAADRQDGSESIYVHGAKVAERLLADPRELRVLHGDIHHRNIRMSGRGWLSFDPKGLVGERTYDCANSLCNPPMTEIVHNEARLMNNAAILAEGLGIDLGRILAFTYAFACLNASSWMRIGNQEIVEWYLKVARIIEPHIKTK